MLAVACHPDPRVNQIASACRDGSVLFWDTNKPAPDKDQSKEQGDISVNNGDGENRPLRSEENYVIADPQAVIRDVNESTVKMDTVEE